MKRSILLKLILAFLFISIVSVVLLVASASYGTGREFDTYLVDRDKDTILNYFAKYYEQHNSWAGVTDTLPELYQSLKITDPELLRNPPFTLADSTEKVVLTGGYYKAGDVLLQKDEGDSQLITVSGATVGYLLIRNPLPHIGPQPAGFIQRVNTRLIVSGIAALAIALLLGVIISRIFTRPLRELTQAAREVANGNLDQKVDVRSSDELGELTAVFNDMTAKLSRLIESRKRMTADIAHELRTPISIILGHAEGIHDGVLPASPETIEIIREEAIRLEQLVNDLRVLALSDSGELSSSPSPTSPNVICKTIVDLFRYQAKAKDITLEMDCPSNLPDVMVDKDRMVQVFSNLVDNAIRITPPGGQVILATRLFDHQIEFTVRDTGHGISPEDLDKIFDRLYRTDQSRKRDQGGSGLGLAIAKSIVEQHGGKVWAESKLGEGTTMHVLLPVITH
jgi:signal transduction histidine kinase